MSTLERAIEIARKAHAGQIDKGGADYIGHPLRVMAAVEGTTAKIVAVLHDVVEDCPSWTLGRLRDEGFSEEILQALDSVTKRPLETYPDFIKRCARNATGRLVKLADLADNCNSARLPALTSDDLARFDRYARAIAQLKASALQ